MPPTTFTTKAGSSNSSGFRPALPTWASPALIALFVLLLLWFCRVLYQIVFGYLRLENQSEKYEMSCRIDTDAGEMDRNRAFAHLNYTHFNKDPNAVPPAAVGVLTDGTTDSEGRVVVATAVSSPFGDDPVFRLVSELAVPDPDRKVSHLAQLPPRNLSPTMEQDLNTGLAILNKELTSAHTSVAILMVLTLTSMCGVLVTIVAWPVTGSMHSHPDDKLGYLTTVEMAFIVLDLLFITLCTLLQGRLLEALYVPRVRHAAALLNDSSACGQVRGLTWVVTMPKPRSEGLGASMCPLTPTRLFNVLACCGECCDDRRTFKWGAEHVAYNRNARWILSVRAGPALAPVPASLPGYPYVV
ncbi:hypothetical protein BC828DRAFT_413935 [Blastocladiella britannica]|nr:hypothetical protein BC828DRAFT_413935 [Blastocladiella britannica]